MSEIKQWKGGDFANRICKTIWLTKVRHVFAKYCAQSCQKFSERLVHRQFLVLHVKESQMCKLFFRLSKLLYLCLCSFLSIMSVNVGVQISHPLEYFVFPLFFYTKTRFEISLQFCRHIGLYNIPERVFVTKKTRKKSKEKPNRHSTL